jgi:DNA repair exonuclease SbcCD ATPase subunit
VLDVAYRQVRTLDSVVEADVMDIDTLTASVASAEKLIEREIGEAKALAKRAQQDYSEADQAEARADALEKVVGILNSFADARQEAVQSKIEALVTHGLQTIFDDSLTFHVVSETKSRRVETRFVVRSRVGEQEVETGLLDARGGGVAAVAGFLLRLIVVLLRPDVRPFLLLDESFSMVSEEYEPRLVDFVKELTEKTPVQIVLVTHKAVEDWSAAADKIHRFKLKNGRTVTEAVK